MDNNRPKDGLEELFGRFFNDDERTAKAEGWNVPGKGVWAGIEKSLSQERQPKRSILFWYWRSIAASILFIFGGWFITYYHFRINELSDQLNQLETFVSEKTERLKIEKGSQDQNIEIENSIPSAKFLETVSSNDLKAIQTFDQDKKENHFGLKKGKTVIEPLDSNALVPRELSNSSNYLVPEPLVSTIKKPAIIELPKLVHQLNPLPIPDEDLDVNTPLKISPTTINKRWYLAADFSPIWQSLQSNQKPPDRFAALPKAERQEHTYSAGLSLGLSMRNGWGIESGIRYTTTKITILHDHRVTYGLLTEQLNNLGQYESTVNLLANSSAGILETNILLVRNSDVVVSNDTPLNFNTSFSHQIHYLEVPILLRKRWALGRLGLTLKAGAQSRFLIKKEANLNSIALDDKRFQFNFEEGRRGPRPLSNISFYYVAGVGVDYNLDPKWSLFVEPTFSRSLEPVVNLGKAKVFSEQTMVNLGMRYQL